MCAKTFNKTRDRVATMIENYLGSRFGKLLIQFLLIVSFLGVFGWAGNIFFGFVREFIWTFFQWSFEGICANRGIK